MIKQNTIEQSNKKSNKSSIRSPTLSVGVWGVSCRCIFCSTVRWVRVVGSPSPSRSPRAAVHSSPRGREDGTATAPPPHTRTTTRRWTWCSCGDEWMSEWVMNERWWEMMRDEWWMSDERWEGINDERWGNERQFYWWMQYRCTAMMWRRI